jgi:hypothetical protein
MGHPYAPQQLTIRPPRTDPHGFGSDQYTVMVTIPSSLTGCDADIHIPVCHHTTYITAWKCKHGQCTKGHNLAQATTQAAQEPEGHRRSGGGYAAVDDGGEV